MIPSRLNEINPMKLHYRRRIRDNQLLYIRDFFSPTIGPFRILKMWHNVEYIWHHVNAAGSHWFHYNTIKVKTPSGDTLLLRQEYLEREGAFNNRVKI